MLLCRLERDWTWPPSRTANLGATNHAVNYFFPHVLLLASLKVMDTQAQCQTNASEESHSYMEQCSWDNLVLFTATHAFPLFNPFWRLPLSSPFWIFTEEEKMTHWLILLICSSIYFMAWWAHVACKSSYRRPTNMPLSVDGNFQWEQRQNCR